MRLDRGLPRDGVHDQPRIAPAFRRAAPVLRQRALHQRIKFALVARERQPFEAVVRRPAVLDLGSVRRRETNLAIDMRHKRGGRRDNTPHATVGGEAIDVRRKLIAHEHAPVARDRKSFAIERDAPGARALLRRRHHSAEFLAESAPRIHARRERAAGIAQVTRAKRRQRQSLAVQFEPDPMHPRRIVAEAPFFRHVEAAVGQRHEHARIAAVDRAP